MKCNLEKGQSRATRKGGQGKISRCKDDILALMVSINQQRKGGVGCKRQYQKIEWVR